MEEVGRELKSCCIVVDKLAVLRSMGRNGATLRRQMCTDLKPPAVNPMILYDVVWRQRPSPNRICEETDIGEMGRRLADQRCRFMISVRIMAPGNENGAAAERGEPRGEMTSYSYESSPGPRCQRVPNSEKYQALDRQAKMSDSFLHFLNPNRREAMWGIGMRSWMRGAAVGEDRYDRWTPGCTAGRDQPTAPETFIIGVWCKHKARLPRNHLFQRSYR